MTHLLAPPPRSLRRLEGTLRLRPVVLLPADANPGIEPTRTRLARRLAAAGVDSRTAEPGSDPRPGETPLRLRLDPATEIPDTAAGSETYRLVIEPQGVAITAAAAAGLFHGAGTFSQWLTAHSTGAPGAPPELPAVDIEDGPGLSHRGLLLDISRNRVPTMESLFRLVDTLANLKLNQLQLYTEHTFAYRGHEVVWRGASPLTATEVRRLDAHCRERFIELVPNQNSFGHLHRWLRHEPYRRLAEVPEGLRHPFGDEVEPFSLCPVDPGAVDLLRDLYGQLLPLFSSGEFNIGCDETFDLGKGRSAEACRERGAGRVYLEFLRRLHGLAAEHGRRIQFWGDILAGKPELLTEVPGDAVALEWGYEAGHPFAERAAALAGAGLEFYLCPGTSSWNSFGGRLDNAVANLAEAALAAREHGASGYLITDWGDFGHLQPPPVSWPPLVAGAAFAWSPAAAERPAGLPLPALVDHHAAAAIGVGVGEALARLGNAYQAAGVTPMNASALFKLVNFADRTLADAGLEALTAAGLDEVESVVAEATAALARGDGAGTPSPAAPDTSAPDTGAPDAGATNARGTAALVRGELAWVAGMLRFACRLGRARLAAGGETPVPELPAGERRALARELGRRIEELSPLWLARSRPGGLDDSRGRLERVHRLLAP